MAKLAKRLGKPTAAINVIVSRAAAKRGISAEAALIIVAKEHGIGTSVYQRKLDSAKQAEVRDALPALFPSVRRKAEIVATPKATGNSAIAKKTAFKLAIEYLVRDPMLLERCQDLLMARSKYDRAINQATQILEDRIRKKANPPKKLVGENLVGFAFNEDPSKSVLRVESGDGDDQRGFTQILRGLVPAFRNKAHHHITDSLSRDEAMRVVGFIDVLLRVVDNSTKTTS
ncbi:MAG: TIGR02391 family protein [Rhizomicrobium sp.]